MLVLFVSLHLYFLSETSLYYGQSTIEPIRIYWRVIIKNILVNPNLSYSYVSTDEYPNYTISNIDLEISDAIGSSNIRFLIVCQNFSGNIDFLYPLNGGFEGNFTKVQEYEQANPPDLLLTSGLLQDKKILAWSQIWNNPVLLNTLRLKCNPFFKQVGFNAWECAYLFDGSFATTDCNNETFATASVSLISFHLKIPKNYNIQNPEELKTSTDSSGSFLVSKDIGSGETFQLKITDSNSESTRILLSAFSYLGFASIIISLIIDQFRRK
jgi:hypothetical protein